MTICTVLSNSLLRPVVSTVLTASRRRLPAMVVNSTGNDISRHSTVKETRKPPTKKSRQISEVISC